MSMTCPNCSSELTYKDRDDALENCVCFCNNDACSNPFMMRYYEEPAHSGTFRMLPPWEECYWEVVEKHGTNGSDEHNLKNTKRADHLFLKRYDDEGNKR